MKKTTIGMGAVVVGFAMLALSAVSSLAAQRPGFETYVVRSGDTLAKISGRVYGDESRWREMLKDNPQITNANLIFPGDTLLVAVPETAASPGETDRGLAARAGADAGTSGVVSGSVGTEIVVVPDVTSDQGADDSGAAAAPEPPIAVVSPALYRSAGHIADKLPEIAIVASQDDRILLGTDDAAIVNAPITPGERFTVVRANRRIFHPVTGAYLGWLVRILGSAEVTCRGERTSTVALRTTTDTVGIGDYLLPIDKDDVLEQNVLAGKIRPECIPAGAYDGVIVASNEERDGVGEQDLAYIDLGTTAGVTPGRRFTIYREIAPEGCVAVGELQVLRAGAHSSTALITTSFQEVMVGHLLRAR